MWLFVGLMLWAGTKIVPPANNFNGFLLAQPASQYQALPATPVFRYPVVDNAEISSYFDHDDTVEVVTFYDGRRNSSDSGFLFSCPAFDKIAPGEGNSWVGCATAAADEANCPDNQELWYDKHRGLDYEYAANWRTGSQCDLSRFDNVNLPVYAPAQGLVDTIGEAHPFNGNFILLYHDLNRDGNFYNDGLRSYYLHFADNGIIVDEGQIVQEGDLLGYGGMTGLAWTPHLHFEVQRQTESGWQPVDPFGWAGAANDPWIVPNFPLWKENVSSNTQ
jgi:hypothetical protein